MKPYARVLEIPEDLVAVIRRLSLARTQDDILDVVRTAARSLVGADGVTLVLREGDKCHYAEEDAIGPLWKGRRFPAGCCISGWDYAIARRRWRASTAPW